MRKRFLVTGVVALLAGGAVAGIASVLDTDPDRAAQQRAPLQVGAGMQNPNPTGSDGTREAAPAAQLPPLTLILDRPAPDGIAELDAAQQVVRLRPLAQKAHNPRRWVELGRAHLELGDVTSATTAFQSAIELNPRDPAAQIGLAFVDFMSGDAGKVRSRRVLTQLSQEHPNSQLVSFNRGWLAAYAGDADQVRRSWTRTVAQDKKSPLGRVAKELLDRLNTPGG